jgi:hypothetical protein
MNVPNAPRHLRMNLTQYLNPRHVSSAAAIGDRFSSNAPFPHVVLDDFLAPDYADELLFGFPSFDRGYAVGDDGKTGDKSTVSRIRALGDAYARLDDLVQSPDFLQWLSEATQIPELLYDPFYLGGGTHNNREGMSLNAHIDFNYHASERWHRRLNLLVYLNHDWQHEWGGALELYKDPHQAHGADVSITPLFNRCVIFATTEHSWHGFDRISLPEKSKSETRKSIALYFYTKERPQQEIADRHTTIYVQRQLPPHFQPGHVLSDADVETLRQLIAARDAHIQMQYDDNTALLKAQDRGFGGQIIYLAKRLIVRLRR